MPSMIPFINGGGEGVHFDGNRLSSAPKWTRSASAIYDMSLSDLGSLSFSVDYSYKSSYFLTGK